MAACEKVEQDVLDWNPTIKTGTEGGGGVQDEAELRYSFRVRFQL